MTELHVESLIGTLLLACCVLSCQGTKDICLPPGTDFLSDICQATSNSNSLYWKYNDTLILSNDEAVELGVYQNQGYFDDGRLFQNVTVSDVRSSFNLLCYEGQRERLSYSVLVSDMCDPPLGTGTGDVYSEVNPHLTNTTTGPRSCDESCIAAAVSVTVVGVGVGVGVASIIVGLCVYVYRRNRRNRRRPPAGGEIIENDRRPPGDSDDNHGNDAGGGDGQAPPTEPVFSENTTEGTMHVGRTLSTVRTRQPGTNISRDSGDVERGLEVEATSAYGPPVKAQPSVVENENRLEEVTTVVEQCTDEGAPGHILCYDDKIRVNLNGSSSYEKTTFCLRPQSSTGHENISV